MLPTIPQDKAGHFIYGAALALSVYALALLIEPSAAAVVALTVSVIAGVIKEASDRVLNLRAMRQGLPPPHGVELMDAIATSLGGALVFTVGSLPDWIAYAH